MEKKRLKIALLFLLLIFAGTVNAKELYVDSNNLEGKCNNSYSKENNSISMPWCNIFIAEFYSEAGDIINLRNGVYNESRINLSLENFGEEDYFGYNNTGESGKPITYRSFPGEKAIITFPDYCYSQEWVSDSCGGIFYVSDNSSKQPKNIIFRDIIFDGKKDQFSFFRSSYKNHTALIKNRPDSSLIIEDSVFKNFADSAIISSGQNITILSNIFENIGNSGDKPAIKINSPGNIIFKNNYLRNIGGPGIELSSNSYSDINPSKQVIAYNIFQNVSVHNFSDSGQTINNYCVIISYPNTIFSNNICATSDSGFRLDFNAENGTIIANNIFKNIKNKMAYSCSGLDKAKISNNILNILPDSNLCTEMYAGIANITLFFISKNNSFLTPKFYSINPKEWTDYRPVNDSIQIDNGLNLGNQLNYGWKTADIYWPPSLIEQEKNGFGWDIGVYVYPMTNMSYPNQINYTPYIPFGPNNFNPNFGYTPNFTGPNPEQLPNTANPNSATSVKNTSTQSKRYISRVRVDIAKLKNMTANIKKATDMSLKENDIIFLAAFGIIMFIMIILAIIASTKKN